MDRKKLEKIIKEEGNLKIFCHRGFTCVIKRPYYIVSRHEELIHLCGYVYIPEKSILGKWAWDNRDKIQMLNVHGGVTYFECENGFVVIGFDTGHPMDISMYSELNDTTKQYRDMHFMVEETKKMVDDLLIMYATANGLKNSNGGD